MGYPRCDRCTLIWCVLPVMSLHSSSETDPVPMVFHLLRSQKTECEATPSSCTETFFSPVSNLLIRRGSLTCLCSSPRPSFLSFVIHAPCTKVRYLRWPHTDSSRRCIKRAGGHPTVCLLLPLLSSHYACPTAPRGFCIKPAKYPKKQISNCLVLEKTG